VPIHLRRWELEKHKVAHRKLEKSFKDPVQEERVVLKAIGSPETVATFRIETTGAAFRRQSSGLFFPVAQLKVLTDRVRRSMDMRHEAVGDSGVDGRRHAIECYCAFCDPCVLAR